MLFDERFPGPMSGYSANGHTKHISIKKLLPVPLIASIAMTSGILAFEPARAQAVAILATITCSSSSPCAAWQNKGSGTAIQGNAVGDGVRGISTGSGKSGVYGETDSTSGYGVHGTNTAAGGIAVYATGGAGYGVKATTTTSNAVNGTATGGIGVVGESSTSVGIDGYSASGYGAQAASGSGLGLFAETFSDSTSALEADNFGSPSTQYASDGVHIYSRSGNGALIQNGSVNGVDAFTADDGGKYGAIVGGTSQGLIATTGDGTNGIPLQAGSATPSGTGTGFFYVDGSGNIHYTGGLKSYARTRGGLNVTAFETKSTQANVEDSGTAQLVAGSAFVPLDAAFAQSIDMRSAYRVFLTPDGDTRGLYIASKTPAGFYVRETQGGRGTFAFDYRILGSAAGDTGERMALVTPAVAARAFPMLRMHPGRGPSRLLAPSTLRRAP
jgi:hypothetical protein